MAVTHPTPAPGAAVSGQPPEHLVADLERALDAAPPSPIRRSDVPRELLVRPTIPGLLRDAAVDWAVIALAWAATLLLPEPAATWTYPLWALVVAGRFHSLGVVLHDAAHMPLRGKPPATRLLEALAGYPIATTLNAMRYHHIRHHRDSGMATDPYYKRGLDSGDPHPNVLWLIQWLRGLLLVPFWTVRPVFGLLSLALPGLRNVYGRVFLQDLSGDDLTDSAEVRACARAELGQFLVQSAVIAALVVWPDVVVRLYLIPAFATGLLASYRLLAEHAYVPTADRKPDTILATTNDHGLGAWGRAVSAPRHIGYHVVHHLHPQVAWHALPALRAWYRQQHPDRYPAPRPWLWQRLVRRFAR